MLNQAHFCAMYRRWSFYAHRIRKNPAIRVCKLWLKSGIFELLEDLCETIREKRERVLIFTQFKEMYAPLDEFLSVVFGIRGPVIHGGTILKKRGEIV